MVNFLADGSEIFRFNRKHDIFATRMRYMNTIYLRYDMFASRTWIRSVNFRRAEIFILNNVPLCGTYHIRRIYRVKHIVSTQLIYHATSAEVATPAKRYLERLIKGSRSLTSPAPFRGGGARGWVPICRCKITRISTKSLYGRAITCICPQKN